MAFPEVEYTRQLNKVVTFFFYFQQLRKLPLSLIWDELGFENIPKYNDLFFQSRCHHYVNINV